MTVKVSVQEQAYDWKKTVVKGAKSLTIILLTGLVVVWQDNPAFLAAVPLVEMLLNYVKHKNVS